MSDDALWAKVAEAKIRTLRIPTPFQVGRVNCYLLEDEPLTLIDAGPNSGKALDELEHQLAALGHRIEELELVVITHQHIDHLGLVDIVARRSGAEVAAIDVLAPFVENFGADAERDDDEAAALMRRHGISEDVVTALRQVTGSFRAWGSKARVTRPLRDGESLRAARPLARGPAAPGPQPLGHPLLGRGAADPDRRRPPDRAHLLEPAALAAPRRLERAPPGPGRLPDLAEAHPRAADRRRPRGARRADRGPRRPDRRALPPAPAPGGEALRH